MKKILLFSLLLTFMISCTSIPLRIENRENIDSGQYEILGEASAKATGIMLFNFIPIKQNTRFQRAYDAAVTRMREMGFTDEALIARNAQTIARNVEARVQTAKTQIQFAYVQQEFDLVARGVREIQDLRTVTLDTSSPLWRLGEVEGEQALQVIGNVSESVK